MKTILIPIPKWMSDTFFFLRRLFTPTPIAKTQEELEYEFNFHFAVANKKDMIEFVEKCKEVQHCSVGEEQTCKCHKTIFIADSRTGKIVHTLEMTVIQAQWFKQNIHSFMPMKEGTVDDRR